MHLHFLAAFGRDGLHGFFEFLGDEDEIRCFALLVDLSDHLLDCV